MKNFVQKGERMNWTATKAVVSGQAVLVGKLVGVATCAGEIGDVVPLAMEGVFTLPKVTGAISTQGVPLYWDDDGDPVGGTAGTGALTATGTDQDAVAGASWASAASGDGTVQIKLGSVALAPVSAE